MSHHDGDLVGYDLATGRPCQRWPARAIHLAFRPDGAQIAVIDDESKPPACRILEGESGRLVRTFPLRAAADDVAWSPDGTTLATPCGDFKIDLWDAATGIRRATLEGHDNSGLSAAFHPAGTLLASNGWEGRLRLWDPVLGRPWLSLTGGSATQFSQDGRIVVALEDKLTTYQVDPALEYRTFAHASRQPMDYADPSIRHDGRVLAVGSDRGAVLWDLARGTELAFLPIGNAWNLMFEPSGDLITNGSMGVQRWPIQLDPDRGEFRIGPPRQLRLPASLGGMAEDRSGRIVAKANHELCLRRDPGADDPRGPAGRLPRRRRQPGRAMVGDQQSCGSAEPRSGASRMAQRWPSCPSMGAPWLASAPMGSGWWREIHGARSGKSAPGARCGRSRTSVAVFSPDGRLAVVVDPSRVIRLVELETGRTLARLASPDLCGVQGVAFSPDGSRLVVTTKDRPTPAVHVWDLRAIRKHLARMGLDWDAPAYSEDDPADPGRPPCLLSRSISASWPSTSSNSASLLQD